MCHFGRCGLVGATPHNVRFSIVTLLRPERTAASPALRGRVRLRAKSTGECKVEPSGRANTVPSTHLVVLLRVRNHHLANQTVIDNRQSVQRQGERPRSPNNDRCQRTSRIRIAKVLAMDKRPSESASGGNSKAASRSDCCSKPRSINAEAACSEIAQQLR
jgi:hypothetical protein